MSVQIATLSDGAQVYQITCADPDGNHATRSAEPYWADVLATLSIDASPDEVERAQTGYVCYPCYRAVYEPVPDPESEPEQP